MEDVGIVQQLATSLHVTEKECKPYHVENSSRNQASSSHSSATDHHESLHRLPSSDVMINVVAPEYQELSNPNSQEAVYHSGWREVHDREGQDADKGKGDVIEEGSLSSNVFTEMTEKFQKKRSDMDPLPISKMREFTGMVASELDKIADELPVGGYLLDVIWLMPTSTDFPILERPDAFLFSVMRRLEVWHNARVTILLGRGLEGQEHPSLVHWKTFIESRVVPLTGSDGKEADLGEVMASSASLAWQGQVKYISSRGTTFPPWPGFSLHRLADDSHRSEPFIEILNPTTTNPRQEVCSSQQSLDDSFITPSIHDMKPKHVINETLEFIHLANLHEIPTWFILPGKFELRLRDHEQQHRYSRSRFWLRYLTHRLPGDGQGAICQLSCMELDGPVPAAQSQGLSTRVWTEGITNNPLNPPVPNVQLKGTRHTFFFLVHGDRRGRCIALPLVSPFMLNGAAHALLAHHEEAEDTTEESEDAPHPPREVIDSLPTISGRQLLEDEEQLAKMQIKALAMVIEKIRSEGLEINVTPSLLIFLFNYMRKAYYEGYQIGGDSPGPSSGSHDVHVGEGSNTTGEHSSRMLW